MKFRVRFGRERAVLEMADDQNATLRDLKSSVLHSGWATTLQLPSDVGLSLDGQTVLEDNCTLKAVGLVSGDLLHILLPPGVQVSSPSSDLSSRPLDSVTGARLSGDTSLSRNVNVVLQNEGNVAGKSVGELGMDVAATEASSELPGGQPLNENHGGDSRRIAGQSFVTAGGCVAESGEDIVMVDEEAAEVNRYLNEPMLVRECTGSSFPHFLLDAYKEGRPQSPCGALAVLIKVLMNELGFREYNKVAVETGIHGFLNMRSLQMDFIYLHLPDAKFSLLLVPLHKCLIVHGRVQLANNETSYKTSFVVSEFINSTVSADTSLPYLGARLPTLSRLFKDAVGYPLLQFASAGSGLNAFPDLSTLLFEIQLKILKYLDCQSLLRLSQVCWHLSDTCQSPIIWRQLYIRDFGTRGISDPTLDWKTMYKSNYIQRKKWRDDHAKRRFDYFAPYFPSNPFPYPRRPPFLMPGQTPPRWPPGSNPNFHEDEHLIPTIQPAFQRGGNFGRGGGGRSGLFLF